MITILMIAITKPKVGNNNDDTPTTSTDTTTVDKGNKESDPAQSVSWSEHPTLPFKRIKDLDDP